MGANLLIHVGALTVIQLKLIFEQYLGPMGPPEGTGAGQGVFPSLPRAPSLTSWGHPLGTFRKLSTRGSSSLKQR